MNEAAAGVMPLRRALSVGLREMVQRPHMVVRSPAFGLVMGVYGATYGTANFIDVMAERNDTGAATHNSLKLVGTTAAYTSSSIVKDVAFAKMFSKESAAAAATSAAKRAVPITTYGTFLFRDSLIIGAGFILPQMVSSSIQSATEMERKHADKVAQLATPMGMQIFITPIHLLGLNFYNAPTATLGQRLRSVWSTCPESTGIRMFRFLWAYGIGGVVNKDLTQRARDWTVETYCEPERAQLRPEQHKGSQPVASQCVDANPTARLNFSYTEKFVQLSRPWFPHKAMCWDKTYTR